RTLSLSLWVAVPLDGDLRGGGIDVPKVVGRKLNRGRGDVLIKAAELRRAGNRDDPRLLRQQPGQGDLRGRGALLRADLGTQINHRCFGLPSLGRKAWQADTVVVAAEGGGLVDFAGEESPTQRTKGDKSDPQLLARRQHLRLRLTPPDGVFTLDRRE